MVAPKPKAQPRARKPRKPRTRRAAPKPPETPQEPPVTAEGGNPPEAPAAQQEPPQAPLVLDDAERALVQRNVTLAEKIERLIEVYVGRDREVLAAWENQLRARVRERLGVDIVNYTIRPDGSLEARA